MPLDAVVVQILCVYMGVRTCVCVLCVGVLLGVQQFYCVSEEAVVEPRSSGPEIFPVRIN